jgi:predicted DNA binding CopG/RHH family protein
MSDSLLDQDEKAILDSYEAGEWLSVKQLDSESERFRSYARATMRKDARVNIRISSKDLQEIQKKAIEEGIPYQTLISSVLHKFVTGRLTERRE